VLASDGNQASYRVREQLANRSLPSDAVGTTTNVSGKLALGADGQPIPAASSFSVDLTGLRSDAGGRDRYVRQNTLQTDSYPKAEFTPKTVQGLPSPLPTSGKVTFELIGDLTIHGVTKPATWNVTADVKGQELTGAATTTFTFSDFGMQVPRVFVVLSVEDKIQLEYDFRLVPASSGS
jgi:polyisoprenoid-binding protein YceI